MCSANQASPPSLQGNWAVVAQDKLLTYDLLNSLCIATPTIQTICHSVREYGRAVGLKSASAVAEYLRKETPYPLIAKPIRGIFSQDVWLLEGYDPEIGREHV